MAERRTSVFIEVGPFQDCNPKARHAPRFGEGRVPIVSLVQDVSKEHEVE